MSRMKCTCGCVLVWVHVIECGASRVELVSLVTIVGCIGIRLGIEGVRDVGCVVVFIGSILSPLVVMGESFMA